MEKAVYIRTSTEDQEPENQIRDIEILSGKDYGLYQDKQSAWKDNNKEREQFVKLAKDISAHRINDLYCWDLDRLFRKRKKLIEFFEFCKIHKCKVHSFRQQWLEQLNNIPEPFNEMMHGLMLNVMGWLAEEESQKKSERVRLAVRKDDGVTKSYKGNKWGRKSLSKNVIAKVLELKKNNPSFSIRDISNQVTYYDKNNNIKPLSRSAVHKIIVQNTQENVSDLDIPKLSD